MPWQEENQTETGRNIGTEWKNYVVHGEQSFCFFYMWKAIIKKLKLKLKWLFFVLMNYFTGE